MTSRPGSQTPPCRATQVNAELGISNDGTTFDEYADTIKDAGVDCKQYTATPDAPAPTTTETPDMRTQQVPVSSVESDFVAVAQQDVDVEKFPQFRFTNPKGWRHPETRRPGELLRIYTLHR